MTTLPAETACSWPSSSRQVTPSGVIEVQRVLTKYLKFGSFFQAASKFKVRYATFGFQPDAKVDDGTIWPVAYALTELTSADEARIAELVKKAAS